MKKKSILFWVAVIVGFFIASIVVAIAAIWILIYILNSNVKDNTPEDKKSYTEQALEYMEDKYGEQFEFVAPWGNSMSGTKEIIVHSATNSDADIIVAIDSYREDYRVFRDNYIAVKYEDKFKDFVAKKIEQNTPYKNYKIKYSVPKRALSSVATSNYSFEQYLYDDEAFFSFYIIIELKEEYDSETNLKAISKELAESIYSSCDPYYLSVLIMYIPSDNYQNLNMDDIDLSGMKYILRLTYESYGDYGVKYEWKKRFNDYELLE